MASDLRSILSADISWSCIIGGLGLFLFGIQSMGEALKNYFGDKLQYLIDKYTASQAGGILVGTLITGLIQSSSGTTALTIGLIRAGLMTLPQAMGVLMGANIGTTATALLVGLDMSRYALYFINIGAVLIMFSKQTKRQYLGQILFGFGCLFFGLDLMNEELQLLTYTSAMKQIIVQMAQNPFISLIGGIVITMIVQSSSAVIAVILQMYGTNLIPLYAALPFLFGANIGTTITAVLASIGGSAEARQAAAFHVLFNISGAFFFMTLLFWFSSLLENAAVLFNLSPSLQLALAHTLFNVITTLLMYPLLGFFSRLIQTLIPSSQSLKEEKE